MTSSQSPETSSNGGGTWTVYRQDDNGNRFVVQKHLSKENADRLVKEFEARGHKQVYWAEPDSST